MYLLPEKKEQTQQKNMYLLPESKPRPQKRWIVGILSLILTVNLAGFTGLFANKADQLFSSVYSVPKIECGDAGLVGCDQDATDDIEDHWFFTTGFPNWISWLIIFAAGASVVTIMIGGGMILLHFGDEEMISKGKKTITISIIGLFVAMFSFFIVKVIENITLPS